MIGITGKRSTITQEFLKLIDDNSRVVFGSIEDLPLDLEQYLLCAGVLIGKTAGEIEDDEAIEMFRVNFLGVARFCDKLFEVNSKARVCVIGSQSGYGGSHDIVYAGTKASLHLYVETKKLQYQTQHLVCVAPTIIEDSGMTKRRSDLDETLRRGKKRRLGRWLQSKEIARLAHFVLHEDALCNTVVRATGGNY
jgi:NAD(P)-dependent dehydrogenase (short-subunit alcohol dehydrogenase family)